jgi:hypothetical protein
VRRELDDLRKRVADLERKYGALLAMLTAPDADTGDSGGSGGGVVEHHGRRYSLDARATPAQMAQFWRDTLGNAGLGADAPSWPGGPDGPAAG